MTSVGVHEAKTNLSDLLRRAEAGEEVVICRSGTPVARLVPVGPAGQRRSGAERGKFTVPDDFNDELPPELFDHAFE